MTDEQIDYALRKQMLRAGVPFDLTFDKPGLYLGAWLQARKSGKTISVSEACEAASFSPDALRQRRKHNPEFRQAEIWARRGEPYTLPGVDEAQDVVVPAPSYVTNVSWPPRPAPPKPEVERPLATGPANTTLATPPAPPRKRKPSRRYTPMWVGGSGMEHY